MEGCFLACDGGVPHGLEDTVAPFRRLCRIGTKGRSHFSCAFVCGIAQTDARSALGKTSSGTLMSNRVPAPGAE
jgi:hypothetical protein